MAAEATDWPLCRFGGCFNKALLEIIPGGRWSKIAHPLACRAHAANMAAAFTDGNKCVAEVVRYKPPAPPVKPASPPAAAEK